MKKIKLVDVEVFLFNNGHFLSGILIIAIGLSPIPVIIPDIMVILNFAFGLFVLMYIMFKKSTPFIFPKLLIVSSGCNLLTYTVFMRIILEKGQTVDSYFLRFLVFTEIEDLTIICAVFFVYLALQAYAISKITTYIPEVSRSFAESNMFKEEKTIVTELYYNEIFGKIQGEELTNREIELKKESDFYRSLWTVNDYISWNQKVFYLITFINVFAGIFIGTHDRSEPLNEALVTYISLAISAGFIVLLPSFLLAGSVVIFHKIYCYWFVMWEVFKDKKESPLAQRRKGGG